MPFNKAPNKVRKEVFVFNLSNPEEMEEYVAILNNEKMHIVRDVHSYDKMSRSIITIWVEVEE